MSTSSKLEGVRSETAPLGPMGVVGKVVARPERRLSAEAHVIEMVRALSVTVGRFFSNARELVWGHRGDEAVRGDGVFDVGPRFSERFRGLHRLTSRDDGAPRCVACLACSSVCPAQCIHIEATERVESEFTEPARAHLRRFAIDTLRCTFCGLCVEACPHDALRMDTVRYAAPHYCRAQFILEKEHLLSIARADHPVEAAPNPAGPHGQGG